MTHTNDDAWQQFWRRAGLLDWGFDPHGVQNYPASDASRQWVSQSCACPYCGHTWEAVAPLGSTGIECPACYECDLGYEWRLR